VLQTYKSIKPLTTAENILPGGLKINLLCIVVYYETYHTTAKPTVKPLTTTEFIVPKWRKHVKIIRLSRFN